MTFETLVMQTNSSGNFAFPSKVCAGKNIKEEKTITSKKEKLPVTGTTDLREGTASQVSSSMDVLHIPEYIPEPLEVWQFNGGLGNPSTTLTSSQNSLKGKFTLPGKELLKNGSSKAAEGFFMKNKINRSTFENQFVANSNALMNGYGAAGPSLNQKFVHSVNLHHPLDMKPEAISTERVNTTSSDHHSAYHAHDPSSNEVEDDLFDANMLSLSSKFINSSNSNTRRISRRASWCPSSTSKRQLANIDLTTSKFPGENKKLRRTASWNSRAHRGGGGKRYSTLDHVQLIGAVCEDHEEQGGIYANYERNNDAWIRIFSKMDSCRKLSKAYTAVETSSFVRENSCVKRHFKELSKVNNRCTVFKLYHYAYKSIMQGKHVDISALPEIEIVKNTPKRRASFKA